MNTEKNILDSISHFNILKIVIWGHKLHTSTHSYIHGAWHKCFKHLNIETLWLDNNDNIKENNFDNSLFLTEGQVDNNIPINLNSYYILHNCWNLEKYKELIKRKRVIIINKFENIIRDFNYSLFKNLKLHYYKHDNIILSLPWATDLLPFEIDQNINIFDLKKMKKEASFVGTIYKEAYSKFISNVDEMSTFAKQCEENNINYTLNKNNTRYGYEEKISYEENKKFIQYSLYCPALQMQWQVKHGYIPCRIFKNISYGGIPVTNNKEVYSLLEEKPLLVKNINNIINEINVYIQDKDNEYFKDIMRDVRDNHTYLNRIETYLDFLKYINDSNIDTPILDNIYSETACCPKNFDSCVCGRVDLQKIYNKYLKSAMSYYYSDDFLKECYGRIPAMRDVTFSYCIKFLDKRDDINILELGTSRSYVDGRFPGCLEDDIEYWDENSPEKWDWSAGLFTKYFSDILSEKKKFRLTTVDLNKKHLKRCKIMTRNNEENITYIHNNSESVIKNTQEKSIDLLYIDTGDMDEITAELHKREAILIIKHNILKDDGLILIDDVRNPCIEFTRKNLGKSKYSIPLFLKNGYELVFDEYQVILKKKNI